MTSRGVKVWALTGGGVRVCRPTGMSESDVDPAEWYVWMSCQCTCTLC